MQRPRKGQERCTLRPIRKDKLEGEVFWLIDLFLSDDATFEKALLLATGSTDGKKISPDKLDKQQEQLKAAVRKLDKREERLAEGIMDGLITKEAARSKRRELDNERGRLEKKRAEIDTQRVFLERHAAHVENLKAARHKYLNKIKSPSTAENQGRADRFAINRAYAHLPEGTRIWPLKDQEKQDLLRTLLPPGSDYNIIVHQVDENTPNDRENPEPLGTMYLEITGLLPVEEVYKTVVLGGLLNLSYYNKGAQFLLYSNQSFLGPAEANGGGMITLWAA